MGVLGAWAWVLAGKAACGHGILFKEETSGNTISASTKIHSLVIVGVAAPVVVATHSSAAVHLDCTLSSEVRPFQAAQSFSVAHLSLAVNLPSAAHSYLGARSSFAAHLTSTSLILSACRRRISLPQKVDVQA